MKVQADERQTHGLDFFQEVRTAMTRMTFLTSLGEEAPSFEKKKNVCS